MTQIEQIDQSYSQFEPTDIAMGEKDLIIGVIFRAFWDALGRTERSNGGRRGVRNSQISGKFFIRNMTRIDWGDSVVNASQLCTLATGNDNLIRKMQRALKNDDLVLELLTRGTKRRVEATFRKTKQND